MTAKVLTCIFVGVLRGQSSRSESSELRGLPCNEWRRNEKKWPKIWSGNKKVLLLRHCPLFAGLFGAGTNERCGSFREAIIDIVHTIEQKCSTREIFREEERLILFSFRRTLKQSQALFS